MVDILNFDATDITALSFKFGNDSTAVMSECTGSIAVETETQTKTKKCGSKVVKELTKPTKMTVTVTAHLPIDVFRRIYGITHDEKLNAGVYSYGGASVGEQFALAVEVADEWQDEFKLLSFLSCNVQSALTFTIDATEDELSMLEIALTANQDALGYWYHEAIASELQAPLTKEKWLTALTPADLKKTAG